MHEINTFVTKNLNSKTFSYSHFPLIFKLVVAGDDTGAITCFEFNKTNA